MINYNPVELILAKRNGTALNEDQIRNLVEGFLSGEVPDYQMSALLMAIYFQGLNKEDLEFLGFKKERSLKLGDEYQIEYSKELEDKLKSFGYKKTWGHEGLSDSYAIFEVDNKDHEDYKKVFLSVRDNPILAPTLVNNEGVEERPLRVHKVSQEEHYDTEDKRINEENKETSRKSNRNR